MLITSRPFWHGACAAFSLFVLAVAACAAHAQTLWETAPARPAPLPTLVTTNAPSTNRDVNSFATPQSGARTKEKPVRRLVAIPPPPATAARELPVSLPPLPAAQVPANQATTTQATGNLANSNLANTNLTNANLNNGNLANPGSLIGVELPDPPSMAPTALPANPLTAMPVPTDLPPLPNMGDLPLPPLDLPTPDETTAVPSQPQLAAPGQALPVQSPFRSASVGARQADEAFGFASSQPQAPKLVQFQPGELVAVVGTEHILAGDMNVFVQPVIDQNRDRIGSEAQEAALRAQLTRQVLPQYVEVKAMYLEFFRDMLGNASPKEFEDTRKQVVTKAGKIFFEKQVPNLLEKYKANDLQELETKLREKSMSLRTLQSQFIEQVLSGQVEQKYIPEEYEIDRDDIIRYYQEHREKWEVPARARWRQLTARFDKYATRTEAQQAIQSMGNEIYLGGKSFEAVAKQSSQGFTAAEGGVFDWTSQGSLKSQPLNEAIFSLPTSRLSQIIEDDQGFHIIEVLEREAAHTKDLAVSQSEIRKTLSRAKQDEAAKQLRARVMKRTPIWTRWPEDIPGSRPLSDAIGAVDP